MSCHYPEAGSQHVQEMGPSPLCHGRPIKGKVASPEAWSLSLLALAVSVPTQLGGLGDVKTGGPAVLGAASASG